MSKVTGKRSLGAGYPMFLSGIASQLIELPELICTGNQCHRVTAKICCDWAPGIACWHIQPGVANRYTLQLMGNQFGREPAPGLDRRHGQSFDSAPLHAIPESSPMPGPYVYPINCVSIETKIELYIYIPTSTKRLAASPSQNTRLNLSRGRF